MVFDQVSKKHSMANRHDQLVYDTHSYRLNRYQVAPPCQLLSIQNIYLINSLLPHLQTIPFPLHGTNDKWNTQWKQTQVYFPASPFRRLLVTILTSSLDL